MEKEVSLPLPDDGSTDIRLSAIHQACPELFAAEITPLNDSVVTLPAKLRSAPSDEESPASPFAPGRAFGTEAFAPKSGSPPTSSQGGSNPFWSPVFEAEEPEGSPASTDSQQQAPEAEPPSQSPPKSDAGATNAEPETDSASDHGQSSNSFAAFDEPFSRPPSDNRASKPEPRSETGEEASQSPPRDFSGNPFESGSGFSTLFSTNAEADSEITPPEEVRPEPTPGWGSMFEPASDVEDYVVSPTDEPQAESPAEEEADKEVEQEPSAPPSQAIPDAAPGEAREDPWTRSVSGGASPGDERSPTADAGPPPEAPKESAEEPENNAAEDPAPVEIPARHEDDPPDLELKAIFSTSEAFTLSKVARKVLGLPGISACALATSAKLVQASRSEESRLGQEAREMVGAVKNLAKFTGMAEATSFTVETDCGMVSLFLAGDCCLTVNREEGEFGPGVREKLILIARNLHKLKE
ncbi:MAG: hypothetical protein WD342_14705 [Verrucomicrobiales bacterium]